MRPELSFENALLRRVGADFFRGLPRTPGVYTFLGESGTILYVGKAKDLRARLQSYKRATAESVSRKVQRLLRQAHAVRIEECASEAAALLRENELLRRYRPFYNVVNKSPEGYCFLALRVRPHGVELRFTSRPAGHPDFKPYEVYGSFKARRLARAAYGSLLRLLWLVPPNAVTRESLARFERPARFLRFRRGRDDTVVLSEAWLARVRAYLRGTRGGLTEALAIALLENLEIPPFHYPTIERDLKTLRVFFELSLRKNRRLARQHGLGRTVIAQDEIDDLLVHELVRVGKVQG